MDEIGAAQLRRIANYKRTLHHIEDRRSLPLLPPTGTGANGHRHGPAEFARHLDLTDLDVREFGATVACGGPLKGFRRFATSSL